MPHAVRSVMDIVLQIAAEHLKRTISRSLDLDDVIDRAATSGSKIAVNTPTANDIPRLQDVAVPNFSLE